MTSSVELFKEPLKIRERLSESGTEMSELQLSMLCGLIKEYRPEKIVEVGVAAGGTTAVILNCLSLIELDTCVYSVDISERYYRDTSRKTGFLAEEYKKLANTKVNHKQYEGGVIAGRLEEIGRNIDFLILDTLHVLPGEVLDFLVVLPYLKDGANVVLHDIFLNHNNNNINSYATRILLSSVVGEKITGRGNDNEYNYIELGAFRVTKDTKKYIQNVFSALLITWQYLPDCSQMTLYRQAMGKYYDSQLMELFDMAVKLNKKTLSQKRVMDKITLSSIQELLEKLRNKKTIFIYGCGVYGTKLYSLLETFHVRVEGYVVSDGQLKPAMTQSVQYISEVDGSECTIVLGMSIGKQREVCGKIQHENWVRINEHVICFLRNNF